MSVDRRPSGQAVIRAEGSVDAATFKAFEASFRWLVEQKVDYVVDLSATTYMSSAAFGLLIKLKTECSQKKGGGLVLVRPQTPIINILKVLGLMDFFRVASSVDEALAPPPAP